MELLTKPINKKMKKLILIAAVAFFTACGSADTNCPATCDSTKCDSTIVDSCLYSKNPKCVDTTKTGVPDTFINKK
jgi:hypothetical protein